MNSASDPDPEPRLRDIQDAKQKRHDCYIIDPPFFFTAAKGIQAGSIAERREQHRREAAARKRRVPRPASPLSALPVRWQGASTAESGRLRPKPWPGKLLDM